MRVPTRTVLAIDFPLSVAQTHPFKRFQCLLVHRADFRLLNLLLVVEDSLCHPEGGIKEHQDGGENEEWVFNERLAMHLEHDEEHHEERDAPVR